MLEKIADLWQQHKLFILLLIFQAIFFSAPHIYGVLHNNPEAYFFTGQYGYYLDGQTDLNGVCDNCFYLGWGYKQAMDGHLLLEDKFQGFNTYRKVFHFWWVFGGHLARILGIDLITFNFLQRVFCGLLLSVILYLFGLYFFNNKEHALVAVVFYVFSYFWLYPWPEASALVANHAEVILPLGNALLVLAIYLTYRFYQYGKGNIYALSFTVLMLEMDYPYGIIPYCTATGAFLLYLLLNKKHTFGYLLKTFLIICLPAFAVVGYNYYLVATDYRLVYCQANNPSPPFWKLFTGYLPFSLLSVAGIAYTLMKRREEWNAVRWYLLFVMISNVLLMRVPISIIPFQMEMVVGIQLPLSFFSVDLLRNIPYSRLRASLVVMIMAFNLIMFGKDAKRSFIIMQKHLRPSYLKKIHYEAMQWLDVNTKGEDQVLAMNYLSTYIPMLTSNRIYNGEYILISGFWPERQQKFEQALYDTSGNVMMHFLKEERIDYILYCDSMHRENKGVLLRLASQYPDRMQVIPINEQVKIISFDWKKE
jgi:hypothetical protein